MIARSSDWILEGDHPAASLTDDVVVMVPARFAALVARGVAAEINSLNQAELLELLQCPIDARPANLGKAAIDLKGRKRAVLPGEQLDHLTPGRAAAEARFSERPLGTLGPVASGSAHQAVSRSALGQRIGRRIIGAIAVPASTTR